MYIVQVYKNLSEAEIVLTFNAEMRGLANYYSLALDMKYKLSKLYFIWQISLFLRPWRINDVVQ
ncbi:group II intron reverse transcriptase/maturase (plasmid) [Escherichia coli]